MRNTKNTAFTLVELIVVITILAVLATVAFISFQGYTSSSRDSVRLADLKNISKSFEFMKTKDQQLPLPDQKVDITASGTIFQYQGVLEEQTLKLSNVHNGGFDPLNGNPYGYAVNAQRNKFQVIGFLENGESIANNIVTHSFADNSDKYTKSRGDDLGILLNPTTREVVTQNGSLTAIDVATTTQEYTLVNTSNEINKESTGSGFTLAGEFDTIVYPKADCNALLKNGFATTSGIYTISPDNVNEYQVYCDMETDGGGWTLFQGAGAKIGENNYTLNTTNPNFDNYNMSGDLLEKILVNKGEKTIKHVLKRQQEDITTYINLNINPKLISLDSDETYLCFNDKRRDKPIDDIDYLHPNIMPVSQAFYNNGKTLYNKKINDILRVRLYCPNLTDDGDNYYSHLKIYKDGRAHHLPWDSFFQDNTSQRYSQYYLMDGYYEIENSELPTFGGNVQWLKPSETSTFNYLNGLNILPENATQAFLNSPNIESNLGFEAYMMVR